MRKALIALAAVVAVLVGAMAPKQAEARCIGCAVGLGIVGGAVLGAAIANSYPAYRAAPGYVVYDGYGAPVPVGCPGGYWARRPVAFDAYGNPIRWSRARFICP